MWWFLAPPVLVLLAWTPVLVFAGLSPLALVLVPPVPPVLVLASLPPLAFVLTGLAPSALVLASLTVPALVVHVCICCHSALVCFLSTVVTRLV